MVNSPSVICETKTTTTNKWETKSQIAAYESNIKLSFCNQQKSKNPRRNLAISYDGEITCFCLRGGRFFSLKKRPQISLAVFPITTKLSKSHRLSPAAKFRGHKIQLSAEEGSSQTTTSPGTTSTPDQRPGQCSCKEISSPISMPVRKLLGELVFPVAKVYAKKI